MQRSNAFLPCRHHKVFPKSGVLVELGKQPHHHLDAHLISRDLGVVPTLPGSALKSVFAFEVAVVAPVVETTTALTAHMLPGPVRSGSGPLEKRMFPSFTGLGTVLPATVHQLQKFVVFVFREMRQFRIFFDLRTFRVFLSAMFARAEDSLMHDIAKRPGPAQDGITEKIFDEPVQYPLVA